MFEFSNYQTLIMAHINSPYKRNRNFQRFWRKKNKSKENKSQYYRNHDYVMHTKKLNLHAKNFFRKMFICVRNSICGWKKNKKFLGQIFKITLKIPSKKCQSYNFHIWELYDKHFFSKNENLGFFYQTILLESNNRRNKFISFFNHF